MAICCNKVWFKRDLTTFAVIVLDEGQVALLVPGAEQFALRRADADGENAHAGLGGFLGGGERFGVRVVVFAVGEEDQDFMIVIALLEGGQGGPDGRGKRRAALGNDADGDGIDRLLEGWLVQRQGRLQKGGAGETRPGRGGRFWPGA